MIESLEKLAEALEALSPEYTPSPEAAAEMDRAIALMLREYDRQGYEDGEQALWNCRGLVIGGVERGDWEITLRRVDAPESAARTKTDFKTDFKTAHAGSEKIQ